MNHLKRASLRSGDDAAPWNFEAGAPFINLTFDARTGRAVAVTAADEVVFHSADPFAALAWMERYDLSTMADARWIGFIAYEFARQVERLPASAADDLHFPDFAFWLCKPATALPSTAATNGSPAELRSRSMTPADYKSAVERSLAYIRAGDVFQINLAQRLTFQTIRPPREIFIRLAGETAADFGALIEFEKGRAIVSDSPELFFRIEPRPDGTRRIINRPIKGTRPREAGMDAELLASPKDRAELAMIVDLQRNDLGRVCEIGSVVVREPRVIEATPTVFHGVATIDGTLRRDAGFADVVRALSPCGSITGCPKVRAMEIIDELEPVVRGPYCGAIGYLAADGRAEFNVAIRTIVMNDNLAHVYVGGGIVADSSPDAEYDETLVKARAMLAALGVESRIR